LTKIKSTGKSWKRASRKGGVRLKKLISILLVMSVAFTLAACAGKSGDKVRVKCPACGYEFDALSDQ
jgi:peptide subunit release factor 1 (eRF1)